MSERRLCGREAAPARRVGVVQVARHAVEQVDERGAGLARVVPRVGERERVGQQPLAQRPARGSANPGETCVDGGDCA